MRKFYAFLLSLLFVTQGFKAISQCTNTSSFGSATINASGTAVTISTCSFAGEYSTINGAVNGQTLRFTSSVATDFITIHSGTSNGPVVASGVTPLVFANTFTGTLYAHWNTSAACGAQSTCRTTTVQCTSCVPPPPPVNDLCSGALPIACGATIAGSTSAATPDAVGTCTTALGTAPGVWYTFAGDGSTTTLSLCGSGYDTKIGVFSGSCAALACVIGNDDFCGLQSQVTFNAVTGTIYYVLVTGFNTNSGNYTLARTCVFPCSGVPSPGFITGPSATVCAGSNFTLTLNGYTTGVTGISYQWKSSPTAGGPYTNIAGATNTTYTGTAGPNRFFVCTVTCANGGGNATTAEFAVNVNTLVHSNVIATPASMCAPGSTTITGTVSGGITTGGSGVLVSSGTINLAIPDNNAAGVNATLTVPATTFVTASDLKVRLNLGHSWSGDLIVKLTSPCGTTFLFDRLGVPAGAVGNSDNFGTNNTTTPPPAIYTFDLAGATVLPETSGAAGFIAAGTYKPSDVNGTAHNWAGYTFPCAGGGTWTLNLSDNAGLDVGTLADWAILGPTAGNYTHSLTGPGTIVQNASTGPNNSNASFSVSNLPAGTHNFTLTSTDVTGCSVSSPVTVTVNPTPVVTLVAGAGGTQTFSYTGPAVAIPDNTPAGVNITLPVSGLPGTIADLNFRFDSDPAGTCNATVGNTSAAADHTFIGDLVFKLTSPSGTTVTIVNRRGGTRENICTTLLDDDGGFPALSTVTSATGQFLSGNFAPDSPLSAFDTQNGNGTWTLNVSDNAGIDVGSMRRFSLIITTNPPPPVICNGAIVPLTATVVPGTSTVIYSPVTELFLDATATTTPYTGTPVASGTTIYAKPTVTRTYTAAATTSAGCTGTPATVTITVNQLPAITVQPTPASQTVCPGANLIYSVTATGTGLTYQWRRDGVNLADGVQVLGSNTNTLRLFNLSAANAGNYDCVVSGVCPPAVTSNVVAFTVASAPVIGTQPSNATICSIGATNQTSATFTVAASGTPAPTIFQWQISTDAGATWTNLANSTLATASPFYAGVFTTSLTVSNAPASLNGARYRLVVTNSCAQTVNSNAVILTVNAMTPAVATDLFARRICLSDTLVPLVGTPVGGAWSGVGVSGFNFVPGATAVGSYVLSYTYTNAAGCTNTDTTLAKVVDCPERERLLSDDGVLVYPNPNNGRFNLRMNSTLYNYLGMKVFDMTGRLVNGKVTKSGTDMQLVSPTWNNLVYGRVIPIDLTYLPSGTYLVEFYYDDGVRTSKKGYLIQIMK